MFTKLLIKAKGKIQCRIHLVQVCIRLADACNWTKHQYGDTYVSQHGNPGLLENWWLLKEPFFHQRKLLLGSSFALDYSRNNFSEVANVFTALSSSPRVPEPMDARDKFVLVSWLDNATQANVFSSCQGSFKGFMSGLSAGVGQYFMLLSSNLRL